MSLARHSRLASALTLTALASLARAQSIADETGLTDLIERLGSGAHPTGAGVVCGQVEASGPGWAPDAANPEFAGKSFTYESGAPALSGHATVVGQFYYGTATGIAPGIGDIHCWEALN